MQAYIWLKPGVFLKECKRFAIERDFSKDLPDFGIGDSWSNHDFRYICKVW